MDGSNRDLKMSAAGVYKELQDFDQTAGLYNDVIATNKSDATFVAEARKRLAGLQQNRQQSR